MCRGSFQISSGAWGLMGNDYEIKFCDGTQFFALHAPRSMPLPIQVKVWEELQKMERCGVISKVQDPTP